MTWTFLEPTLALPNAAATVELRTLKRQHCLFFSPISGVNTNLFRLDILAWLHDSWSSADFHSLRLPKLPRTLTTLTPGSWQLGLWTLSSGNIQLGNKVMVAVSSRLSSLYLILWSPLYLSSGKRVCLSSHLKIPYFYKTHDHSLLILIGVRGEEARSRDLMMRLPWTGSSQGALEGWLTPKVDSSTY